MDSSPDIVLLLPTLDVGGAERVALDLSGAFVQRGLHVELWTLLKGGALADALDPRVKLRQFGKSRLRDSVVPLFRCLRRTRPKTVLAMMYPVTILAIVAAAVARVPSRVVIVEHTTLSLDPVCSTPFRRWVVSRLQRWVYPRAHARVAVSEGVARDMAVLSRLPQASVCVIYNPVDPSKLLPSAQLTRRDGWFAAPTRLLAVGSLKPAKDFATLINAMSLLPETCALTIVGEGELRTELSAQIDRLSLQHRVTLAGFSSHVGDYLAHAHLLVLSSVLEGLPTVILEALACGVPVVSTDCPSGPREILGDSEWGQLTPVGDPEGLAGAISVALSRSWEREELQRRAENFGVKRAVDAYLALAGLPAS